MKKILFIVLALMLVEITYAGDPAEFYAGLNGKWAQVQCSEQHKDIALPEKLSISIAGTRKNTVNVYRLNNKGKKNRFYFSTNLNLKNKTFWKLTKEEFVKKNEINITGTNKGAPFALKMILKDSATIEAVLVQNNQSQSCSFKKFGT